MALSLESTSFPMLAVSRSTASELPGGFNVSHNSSWTGPTDPSSLQDLVATGVIGAVLSTMGVVGVVGNVYTLVVMCRFLRASASMYVYVAYWLSQQASFKQTRRLPNPRVLYLILGIVLLFWACFLPFWLWQLLAQYHQAMPLTPETARIINYLTACLTYGNSCINPFLYTQEPIPRIPYSNLTHLSVFLWKVPSSLLFSSALSEPFL